MSAEVAGKLSLNTDSIATLTNLFGNTQLLQALNVNRYRRTIADFLALRKRLLADHGALCGQLHFERAIELLFKFSVAAQRQVLGYPTFAIWLDHVTGLSAAGSPDAADLAHAIGQIWRFVIACALQAGSGEFECALPAGSGGCLSLPGTHKYFESDSKDEIRVRVANSRLAVSSRDRDFASARLKMLTLFGHDIEINAIDPDFRAAAPDLRFQTLQPEDVVAWDTAARDGWELISNGSPPLADELRHFQVLVPILSESATTNVSGTIPKIPGTSFLSWTPNTPDLVETIIHEYHHQKLDLLLAVDPLIIGPSQEALYYSPWRNDPRPLGGVLHGAYVFQSIFRFWADYFSSSGTRPLLFERRVRKRAYFIKQQVVEAIATLRSYAEFSPLGSSFMSALESTLHTKNVDPPSGDRRCLTAMDVLLRDHKKAWLAANAQNLSVVGDMAS